jgi:hypothetical protein
VRFIILMDMIWKSVNFSGLQEDATTSIDGARAATRQTPLSQSRQ